jgi:rhamnosyltransferase
MTGSLQIPPGLIVTYNPDPELFAQLDSFYAQLEQVIIIDNGSNPGARQRLMQEAQRRSPTLTVIFNESNLGIAKALNQGARWALEQGFQNMLAFDQDSRPAPGMVATMLEVLAERGEEERLAIVAPLVVDPIVNIQARYLRPKYNLLFERARCNGKVLRNVTYVITSGSLYDLKAYQDIGPFRDDFFIDYVDTEYCLRARGCGYRILVACEARLEHRQGERQTRAFGGSKHYPTFHSPLRWYYSSRNRIAMLRKYAFRYPHWLIYEMTASLYIIIKMILFEPQKLAKLRALLLGTMDGLRGRMGQAPGWSVTIE